MRAFDVLTKAEFEIKGSVHPRYHLEMALLRWIHLRRLVPIEQVIADLEKGGVPPAGGPRPGTSGGSGRPPASAPSRPAFGRPDFTKKPGGGSTQATVARLQARAAAAPAAAAAAPAASEAPPIVEVPADFRDRFLAELKRTRAPFFGMVIAQAQVVEYDGRRLLFTFGPAHEHHRQQV